MKKLLAIIAATAITTVAGTAMAATTSTDLTVKASVVAACKASTTTNIDFGNLDPINDAGTTLASSKTSAGKILVECTQGVNYTLTSPATATIANGANTIIYTPVMPTVPANDGAVAGKSYAIDASVDKTAYATAPAGAYTGNLTVTVNY
jgi:spore coat protein U-like protein